MTDTNREILGSTTTGVIEPTAGSISDEMLSDIMNYQEGFMMKDPQFRKKTLNKPHSNVFFVADTHFGHKFMVNEYKDSGYSLRPFSDIDEMDHALITNWNKTIPKRGLVYLLGDVSFTSRARTHEILGQLNGRIHLIYGNHDKVLYHESFSKHFEWRKDYERIKVQDSDAPDGKSRKIVLSHYPFMTWNGSSKGTWHMHGHCHGNLQEDLTQFRLDVGVDCHEYSPIDYECVCELMKDRVFKPVDHHGDKENADGDIQA